MNTFTPFYIVSGAHDDHSARTNSDRTDSLERWLHAAGLATIQVNGCYKGKREPAVMVIDDAPGNDDCEYAVMRLATQYDQESVLAVDSNRQARLIFCNDAHFESIGQWRAVNATEVMERSGASYTERAGQYYTVS